MPSSSLRRDLLLRLMGPLVAVVLVAGASAWGLAQHFSQRVLDQWLYDSAITLARQVRFVAGKARLDVPGSAIEMFEMDVVDEVFYEVTTTAGLRIMANSAVPPPTEGPDLAAESVYYDTFVRELPVRAIAVRVQGGGGEAVLVKVAETRNKRDSLANEVLVATLAIVAMLFVASFALVATGIGRSLSSLQPIVQRVRGGRRAFSPLPEGRDVPSEIRPLVKTINALLREISEEHAGRQRFIADAAHQLRTPIAALRLQLELALREKDPERHEAVLADAAAVLSRTSHLIHRLLTLSRVDQAAEDRTPFVEVDLDRLAREEVESWIDRALAKGIDLGYEHRGGVPVVAGREELLREALSNLIDNAIAYAGPDGPITVGIEGDPPRLFVEDSGAGIPEAERERVRNRFYRMPGTPGEGCGLGLAIVDEIARIHGASLRIGPRSARAGARVDLEFSPEGPGRTP
ncbi:MAG: sensor histidine kinase N-terminal domain-containing protein [Betaproteobacteria bacterium]|nr:sensor histidine kinase N-terminal domain-containing protein [Betaproteobacteria bacterium]